jgi:hypothetical protein
LSLAAKKEPPVKGAKEDALNRKYRGVSLCEICDQM